MATMPQFTFTFFRFTGPENARRTERVREFNDADGMRGLIDRNPKLIETAHSGSPTGFRRRASPLPATNPTRPRSTLGRSGWSTVSAA
jgi:hypothetical protein